MSTDGASASNNSNMIVKAMAATSTTTDGLELWISVCNTLGSACNNPQNGIFVSAHVYVCMYVCDACVCAYICMCLYLYVCTCVHILLL